MIIKYEIRSIRNSEGSGEERKYIHLIDNPSISAKQLKEQIQTSCSLTKGDIDAALSALREAIINELSQGNRFCIPEIGHFYLSVNLDDPTHKPIDKVRGDNINVRNVRFQPCASLLQEIKQNVRFERATPRPCTPQLSETEMIERIQHYLSESSYINRRRMQMLFNCGINKALRYLKYFTEIGLLKKEGTPKAPIYFLNKDFVQNDYSPLSANGNEQSSDSEETTVLL